MLALPQAICNNSTFPKLCELKGKLCIVGHHIEESCWDLWVMNEYGIVDSMMRMFRIPTDIFSWSFHMHEDDTIVFYKPEDICITYKDGRVLRINSVRKYQYHKTPYVYFESFISPHTCLHGKEFNQKIVPNGFSATMGRGKHVVVKFVFPTTLFL
ncbi:hypothetical protein CASFOL_003552 [Castilleja foliolosa]|uniref:Uncharacterized protein n=1 Tax=Castilleja foliolosa TaxID=1961234 RepID=A0ABD3EHW9_9LAMI